MTRKDNPIEADASIKRMQIRWAKEDVIHGRDHFYELPEQKGRFVESYYKHYTRAYKEAKKAKLTKLLTGDIND